MFKEIKDLVHAVDEASIDSMCRMARGWMLRHGGQTVIDFEYPNPKQREKERCLRCRPAARGESMMRLENAAFEV